MYEREGVVVGDALGPRVEVDGLVVAHEASDDEEAQTHGHVVDEAESYLGRQAEVLVLQRDEQVGQIGDEPDDAREDGGAVGLLEQRGAHEDERDRAGRVEQHEHGEQGRIDVLQDGGGGPTAVAQRHLDVVADDGEDNGGYEEDHGLDVPAEPVDPHLHAHEAHGLLHARLLLGADVLGRHYDRVDERDHDEKGEEAGDDDHEAVEVVRCVREAFEYDAGEWRQWRRLAWQLVELVDQVSVGNRGVGSDCLDDGHVDGQLDGEEALAPIAGRAARLDVRVARTQRRYLRKRRHVRLPVGVARHCAPRHR